MSNSKDYSVNCFHKPETAESLAIITSESLQEHFDGSNDICVLFYLKLLFDLRTTI